MLRPHRIGGTTMSTDLQDDKRLPRGLALYAVIAVGIIVVAVFVVVSLFTGGLPGTKDSPSATVKGVSTTGKTAAD
jgi:hypothetical protein